jgi:phage/plasmid-associated DNA primase
MTRGRFFRVWGGQTWEQDHGEVRVWSWVDAMWAAYQRALLQAGIGVEEAAEKAAGLKRAGGGSDADVEKTKATHLKIWNDRMKKHVVYFDRLGSRDGQSSCVEMLAHAPGRCKRDGEFDADPEWLVLGNGVLDLGVVVERLRDGSWTGWGPDALSEHSPSRAVTLLAGDLTYVPEAGVGDVFLRYLEGALPNPAVRWHLQKALGRALLGRPEDKMMLNLIGPPDSGKSVLLEILDDILGDYSAWVSADAFLQERGGGKGADAPNPALHSCRRAKLVLCSEPDSRKAWNSGLLKSLTGRDKQSTRTLHQQIQTWTPRFLLVVASNSFVKLDVADQALLQRIHLIEFPRSFRKPGPGETWESIPVDERADLSLTRRILDDEFER